MTYISQRGYHSQLREKQRASQIRKSSAVKKKKKRKKERETETETDRQTEGNLAFCFLTAWMDLERLC